MTEILKNTLHEHADAISFEPVDLASIRRDGDRTLRRRRIGLTAGGVVAAGAVVAATALAVLPGSDGAADRSTIASDPGAGVEATWVEGSTLHSTVTGDIDLGREASAYLRTSEGYVFVTPAGVVFSLVGTTATRVGLTDPEAIRLVADPTGPITAWTDARNPREVVVLDQEADGATTTFDVGDRRAELTALHDTTAYLTVGDEARSLDLVSGASMLVTDDGSRVLDATSSPEGDVLALGDDDGVRLSRAGVETEVVNPWGVVGTFSPDGAWFSSDAEDPQVISVATGERVSFESRAFATGYEWFDADTLLMSARETDDARAELLACQVPEGTCVKVVELYPFDEFQSRKFVGPIGQPLDY